MMMVERIDPHLHGVLEERARSYLALGFFFDFVTSFTRINKGPLTRDEFIRFWMEAERCAQIQKPVRRWEGDGASGDE